jgi:signal transduction histidine kinase
VRNAQLFVKMNAAGEEAERANQVKTRFLASVTHELRTPLNLIINNMDFMRIGAFGEVNDDQVARLNQTVRSAEHLLYLINDLLDVSKIDAGEMQLFIQPTDIYPLLDDTVDNIYAFIEKLEPREEQVDLVIDIEDGLPVVPMDARRIRQVLTNLLTNAVKFTKKGSISLTVRKAETGIEFRVKDTGIGIPEGEMGKLFAAFERTQEAKESNIEGTGLGLPISQYLVREHSGELRVESVSGEGSTFWFILPFEQPVEKVDHERNQQRMSELLTSKPE